MTLSEILSRPHVIFDVESFGLHGASFAIGAVLVRFDAEDDKVGMREIGRLTATDWRTADRPWRYDTDDGYIWMGTPGAASARWEPAFEHEAAWLQKNIPDSVFAPTRLTGDLSIYQLFDAFVKPVINDVILWAECPVPVEANFLNAMRDELRIGAEWFDLRAPILRDVASLADVLGVPNERSVEHEPAHDPLNDARASAQRLCLALNRVLESQSREDFRTS